MPRPLRLIDFVFFINQNLTNIFFMLRDVQKYFHGHHITINARSEDEVCIDDILEKVSKASASKFNFNGKYDFYTLDYSKS